MTVKPGSCEEILQALALVTLVWLSRVGALCHFHLWRCFLMICDVLTLFLFQTFAAQGTHFDLFWELLLCTDSNTRRTVILETACCLLFQTHLVTAALSQAWHSIWTPQQCESHYTSRKLLWIVDTSTHKKKQFQHGITVLPSEGLEISLNWWCGLKIKTNFLLIRSIDRATQSVKSLFQKWFKDGCTQIIEDRSQIKWWMRWCAWGSAARMSRWTHRRARTHARTYVNARHLSALLFLRVPLAINDLFLQAEQKYDCLWLKYWWLCMNY